MVPSIRAALTSLTLVQGLLASALGADVLVVDPAGGGDFTQIQPAVDASAEGGIVLVRAGSYAETVQVQARSISLLADGAVTCEFLQVRDLAGDQLVVLAGLQAQIHPADLRWTDNLGSIRVQNCELLTMLVPFVDAWIEGCADVVFTDCVLEGATAPDVILDAGPGMHGLWARDSSVALYDCTLQGGDGGDGLAHICICGVGGPGGSGARLEGGYLFAMNAVLQGGDGGYSESDWPGGAGGHGLSMQAAAQAELTAVVLLGGEGGGSLFGPSGPDGAQYEGGPPAFLGLPRRTLMLAPSVVAGTSVQAVVEGRPGDFVFLAASELTDFSTSTAAAGVWALPRADWLGSVPLGAIGASGTLVLDLKVPALPAGSLGERTGLQVFVLDSARRIVLGSPRALFALDPSL